MTALSPLLVCDRCSMVIYWQDWAALGPVLCETCILCWTKMRKATDDDMRVLTGRTNSSSVANQMSSPGPSSCVVESLGKEPL